MTYFTFILCIQTYIYIYIYIYNLSWKRQKQKQIKKQIQTNYFYVIFSSIDMLYKEG